MYEAQTEKDWKYIIDDSDAKLVIAGNVCTPLFSSFCLLSRAQTLYLYQPFFLQQTTVSLTE